MNICLELRVSFNEHGLQAVFRGTPTAFELLFRQIQDAQASGEAVIVYEFPKFQGDVWTPFILSMRWERIHSDYLAVLDVAALKTSIGLSSIVVGNNAALDKLTSQVRRALDLGQFSEVYSYPQQEGVFIPLTVVCIKDYRCLSPGKRIDFCRTKEKEAALSAVAALDAPDPNPNLTPA